MKQLLPVFFLLLAIDGIAQVKRTGRASENLQGPVKSVATVYFRADEKFGELVKDYTEMTETEEYNREGWLTASKMVIRSSVTKINCKYDNAGNLIERKEEDGDETTLIQLLYNAQGQEIEVNTFNGKGALETKIKNKYNEQGQLISAILYNGDGSLREKTLFNYNEKNELQEKSTFDSKNKQLKSIGYVYKDGRLAMELVTKDDEQVSIEGAAYTYDTQGRVILKEEVSASGNKTQRKNEYDSFGNLTKEFTNADNYDNDEFTYDSRNNWIKTIRTRRFAGSTRKYIIERSIKYY